MLVRSGGARSGLSLLEVLVALAIFLFSLAALGHLVTLSGNLAQEAAYRSRAAQLAQSTLAEAASGAIPLTGGSGQCQGAPGFTWTLSAEPGPAPGLYAVTVQITHARRNRAPVRLVLSQFVIDPSQAGSTQDTVATSSSTDPSQAGSGSPSSSSGSATPSAAPPGNSSSGR